MSFGIHKVAYFHTTVEDRPGEAYGLLSRLAGLGVNLLAFTGVPEGPLRTRLTVFPEDADALSDVAGKAGLGLDGPHPALLVTGDDELGALASVHERLADAEVDVYASSGVADGRGGFGYVLYVRPGDFERAASTLDL